MLKIFLISLAVPVGLLLLYVLMLRCRKGHPGLKALQGWSYAHRGLHDKARPENSMSAFQAALDHGYGIELDIHLLQDGSLAVIHDSTLKRTTGAEGVVEDLTEAQLSQYSLEGTSDTIPTFRQVLALFAGKAPLIVELKSYKGNHAALCEAACKLLEDYPGAYCLESFDPRCIRWLRKHRPQLIRGQLARNFFKAKSGKLPAIVKFVMSNQLLNWLTVPDFVAYRFSDRKRLSIFLVRKVWGVQGVTWTLTEPQQQEAAVREGWLPIFENYEP